MFERVGRGLVGLAALFAIAISAVMAAGAVAAPTESNTAFTCVAGSGTLDAHCDPGSSGTSGHVAIKTGESTQLTLTQIGFTTTFKTTIGGSEFIFTATGAECVECMAENHEEVVGGKTVMDVQGSGGHLHYSGVTTNVPTCIFKKGEINTKPLKFTTTTAATALIEPVTPSTVAVIEFEPGCFAGASITITGVMRWTASGATARFETGKEELFVGKQKLEVIGEATLRAGLTGSGTMNPVSLTPA